MPFRIIRNDITLVKADAIVNTANPRPVIGAGTDAAIHKAAGPELLEARKRIGDIAPGQSRETPAYGLPAKYVLHTVSPAWVDGTRGEEALLRQAYASALALAVRLRCRSVAFPLMAAGSYGFPRDLALSAAIGTITDFLLEHGRMTISLVLFNGEAFDLAASLFGDLKSYIDDHYVALQKKAEYPPWSGARYRRANAAPAGKAAERTEELYSAMSAGPPEEAEERTEELYAAMGAVPAEEADELYSAMDAAPAGKAANRTEGRFSAADVCPAPHAAFYAPTAAMPGKYGRGEITFSEHLLSLLKEREGKDSEVYKRAEVSKQLFSKILSNKDYQPTKSTAIQLAIGLQLDLNQTQKLLERAGYVLTRSSKADLVVQYYIEHRVYSITFINEALADCGLPLLKTGLKA